MVTNPLFFYSLWVFVIACGGALILGILCLLWPHLRSPAVRQEEGRSSIHPCYFRLGGVLLAGGFFLALAVDERLVWDRALSTLVLGGAGALLLGLLDDWRPLSWQSQLFGQILLGGLLLFAGMHIDFIHFGAGQVWNFAHLPLLVGAITIGWVVTVMNALNWIDGTDGLLGSVVLVTLGVLAILAFRPEVNQPTLIFLAAMLAGAVTGFLSFNWYPARIVAGTSGTFFLGFLLATLSVYAGAKVATAFLVLALPLLDAISVVLTRLRLGRSPFLPDRNHLHHILLSLGWSPRWIATLYFGVTLVMGMFALTARSLEKLWVWLFAASLFFLLLTWMQWILTKRLKAR